jgi:hypothetical protein
MNQMRKMLLWLQIGGMMRQLRLSLPLLVWLLLLEGRRAAVFKNILNSIILLSHRVEMIFISFIEVSNSRKEIFELDIWCSCVE